MQEDRAAVEGWALVLMAWCGVQRVILRWERPPSDADGELHYQRFLYRAKRFAELLQGRVEIENSALLSDLRLGADAVLGRPSVRQKPKLPVDPRGSESEMEIYLSKVPEAHGALRSAFRLNAIERQLPVGVFKATKSDASRIFTGGKSAVDLIATGANKSLWLFELKLRNNIKVGALSELFFYSMILRDVQHGSLTLAPEWEGVCEQRGFCIAGRALQETKHIHARLLSRSFSPADRR